MTSEAIAINRLANAIERLICSNVVKGEYLTAKQASQLLKCDKNRLSYYSKIYPIREGIKGHKRYRLAELLKVVEIEKVY